MGSRYKVRNGEGAIWERKCRLVIALDGGLHGVRLTAAATRDLNGECALSLDVRLVMPSPKYEDDSIVMTPMLRSKSESLYLVRRALISAVMGRHEAKYDPMNYSGSHHWDNVEEVFCCMIQSLELTGLDFED